MSCSKCSIAKKLEGRRLHSGNVSARLIYERIDALEAFLKAPAGEGGRFDACVKKIMKDQNVSEERAKKICATIGRKKFGKAKFQKMAAKGRNETSQANSRLRNSYNPQTATEAYMDYERTYRDYLDVKLSPIGNLDQMEALKSRMWDLDSDLDTIEREYKRLASEVVPEDTLLGIRIKVRKEKLNLPNEAVTTAGLVQNETIKTHVTKNFIRKRQFDPSQCDENSYRTFERGGKKLVGCRVNGKFKVQSVLEPRKGGGESNEENENDILLQIMGKPVKEQIKIMQKAYPDWSEELIKTMLAD